jgi:O-antigen/teichoic acid export membrane protein
LRKNSAFLIAAVGLHDIFGFLFWAVAARFYSTANVGLAAATISAVMLLVTISGLGFGVGMVRFLPNEKDKSGMVNTCFTIVGLFSLMLAIIFVGGLSIWSPALLFLRQDMIALLIFILCTVAMSLFVLQSNAFIAFRATKFYFIQILISGLRVLLIVVLVGLGIIGIFSSFAVAFCVALIAANSFVRRVYSKYRPVPIVNKQIIKDIFHFSFANYIGESFRMLPGLILPILIANALSPEKSAYFYVAWMIASLLFTVSYSINSSLLAESSHSPSELRSQVIKAGRFSFVVLIPAILLLFLFANSLLSLFGSEYSNEALKLLWILALSSIPVAFNTLYTTVKRVDKDIRPIVYVYAFIALTTIGGGYFLLGVMGLAGIGITWLISNTMVMLVVVPMVSKQLRISPKGLLRKLVRR